VSAVLPLTRAIFVLGVGLTAGTGAGLYVFPARTEDYWAWPIAAEPSAAFFGAGFLGAAVSLALAAREPAWQRVRLVVVLACALTSLALLVTLLNLEPFALDEGGLAETVAWIWLVVYIALPPLLVVAFVWQERAGGRLEYAGRSALGATRVGAAAAGAALGAFGLALVAGWDTAESWWPWPLTRLTAGIVGGWLTTFAIGLLWFAVRDRSWPRCRIGAPGLALTAVLDLAAAVRLWDDVDGDTSTIVYVVVLVALVAAVGAAAVLEGRRADPGLEAS
jgi:hypothetical protein